MNNEYGCSKYMWVAWIVVFLGIWLGMNALGFHESLLALLAVTVYALVGNAIISALARAGTPPALMRGCVWPSVAIGGIIILGLSGLF